MSENLSIFFENTSLKNMYNFVLSKVEKNATF